MVPSIAYAIPFLYPGLRFPVYLGFLLGMFPASAGRPKVSLLSSFPSLLWEVVAGTMVARSVSLINHIFLGDCNTWV